MKKPDPIHFQTDEEYEDYCNEFDKYLRREEWKRLDTRNVVIQWSIVLFTFGLICFGIYLYI